MREEEQIEGGLSEVLFCNCTFIKQVDTEKALRLERKEYEQTLLDYYERQLR